MLRDCLEPDDLTRHLLLAGREIVDTAHYLFLTRGDLVSIGVDDPIYVACYLLDDVGNSPRSGSVRR